MQRTVFIVDDNDTSLAMAKDALKEQYRVLTMPSAAKMFELLNKLRPDLILLDVEMPEQDGFSAIQQLKADPEHESIPVIFLTGMSNATMEAKGIRLGAVDFITKPFSALALQKRIKAQFEMDTLIKERKDIIGPEQAV